MMPRFSQTSKDKLATCNSDLQKLFNEVIKHVDCTITCGFRTTEDQQLLYAQGRTMPGSIVTNCDGVTTLSRHQAKSPFLPQESDAVDVVPYPIDWNDRDRFYHFAGVVRGIAHMMGIKIFWGGDWDNDYTLDDQSFFDYPHFESEE